MVRLLKTVQHGGGSIILWDCFDASGTGVSYRANVDNIEGEIS